MSVHRETLPSGRRVYRVRSRDGDRNRARSFDRRADAEDFDAAERRRQRMGAHGPAEPSRERLDAWLETWVRRDGIAWARSTRLQRGSVMDKWIAPLIGGVRLRELGRARVRDFWAEMLDSGATNATANGAMRVLSAALGAAVEDGLIPANPCLGIKRLPHTPAPARPLSPLEGERLRIELPTPRDQVLWGLMAYAGLRPEEALALRWGDVGATLHVHRAYTHGELKDTKTGRARSVAVIGPLADDLAAWRERSEWAEPGDLVCPSLGRADRPGDATRQGGFLHLSNWRNRAFRPASGRAGLTERDPLQRPRHLREPSHLRGPAPDPRGRSARARRHPDPLAPLRGRVRGGRARGADAHRRGRRSGPRGPRVGTECSHVVPTPPLREANRRPGGD